MAAHSPRPTLQRGFILLLSFLLVTSMLAPIAMAPAAAGASQTCLYEQIGISWSECDRDDPVDVDSDETMMHSMTTAEAEDLDAHYTQIDNHLQDTPTIASIEARHAIATAWEDGKSESEAYQAALEAIRDYYAVHEENHLQQKSKSLVQLANVANASEQDGDITNEFLSAPYEYDSHNDLSGTGYLQSDTVEHEVELMNEETTNITVPVAKADVDDSSRGDGWVAVNLVPDRLEDDDGIEFSEGDYLMTDRSGSDVDGFDIEDRDDGNYQTQGIDPVFNVVNVGDIDDGGLPSETVFDGWDWRDRHNEINDQADQAVGNYDHGFVEALYYELDQGNIEPEDVRSAEGQARFLSGDDEVTGDRFRLATMQMLGMSNPDMTEASSMVVEYEGYTSIEYNGTDRDERVPEYSDHVDSEYQGLLFADDVPEGGFETNQTYTTNDDLDASNYDDLEAVNGSVSIFDEAEGDTIRFEKGNFTVTEMYDGDGERVETVEWEDPEYDTYNASEFAEYLEDVQDLREAIEDMDDDGGDGELTLPGVPDLDDAIEDHGTLIVGFIAIGAAVLIVVSFVTNLLPWT